MKNIIFALIAIFSFVLLTFSCNKPSIIGGELFEGDKLNFQFTDTFSITTVQEIPEAPVMYYGNSIPPFNNHLLGLINDPVFGKTESRIYSEFVNNTAALDFSKVGRIDGVFLEMGYNAGSIYGDTLVQQTLSVYRLTEQLPTNEEVRSNRKFASESKALGSLTFLPKPTTRENFLIRNDANGFDTISLSPRVRIPLDSSFGKALLALDTSYYNNADKFTGWLKGLEVRAETPTSTMLNFNFQAGSDKITGIYIYYKNTGDTTRQQFFFRTTNRRLSYFNNDYTNARIKPYLDNPAKNDTLFLQNMAGTNIKMEIPYVKNLGKVSINRAELEFTIAEDNTNTDKLPPIEQILLYTAKAFDAVSDLELDPALTQQQERMTTFGGFVFNVSENGKNYKKYRFNVTAHLQEMLKGSQGSIIYMVPILKEQKGSRVVLLGASSKHSKFTRAKLNVTYTKL